jgi:hypothetical protein
MQLQSGGRAEMRTVALLDAPSPCRARSNAGCGSGGEGVVSEQSEVQAGHDAKPGHAPPAPVDRGPVADARLYMTGDLRALTGLPRTHMDFYLREGIIQPTLRTESGYLLFDAAELETLRAVLRWRGEGVGIREIRDRLGRPALH